MTEKLRIGYIPLVDAATLLVAVDQGFAAAEGLDIDLVREVSWSNVRDKLNIGLFDAAHLLSPVAIASSLGIGHVRVPLIAPFNLGYNGNAITVSPRLFALLSYAADGDLTDPKVTSRALARVVADRKARTDEPLTFGMTFPFSHHNYQLRYWMAAGGVDPDEDVRMVVLPPPYMVESLASGHIDSFCVGAPWNSVAVNSGVGHILHFGCEIMARISEKVLALRECWAGDNPGALAALVRALARAAEFINTPDHRATVANIIAHRIGTTPELVARTLSGVLKTRPEGAIRQNDSYIVIGRDGANRPDPVQAAWAYAQIVRSGQAPLTEELRATAQKVFRPDLYDSALGGVVAHNHGGMRDGIGAFIGPDFNADDIAGYVSAWRTRRAQRPLLSIVR
jgi:NitT/TauT family transport system ATP-binding protein